MRLWSHHRFAFPLPERHRFPASKQPLLAARVETEALGEVADSPAARDALRDGVGMNLGGGTHHAGRATARGYCLVNDVADD
jgi:acetoin utilization deacetylase AcuC-like enzyme